ncbi:MAG: uroporphyrinogen decarboxylase family protein [Pseudomonadota bacterium]|nr:5-methyltetrahydropteroyltriglutamate--homocysteine methyltransferase [Alphaproteobacteria bacterium]MEC7464160.1 uroporphyrinogen decarboxylase family protein [Pseudomonadota bacterium]MEC7943782.1 uroporphyrinogen decarboxylase family protein [Pseudomonadota bacterium]MEC8086264.1 uroporphyrinogen decarboxylase family protein [Pseudomonadota bacterium]MEC8462946.1 uroporphyrinogen decarboxylase family protein [Pseudomonadota bacterium]|tara:strand:+ start:797 stop:1825 length:1029 start_codon:yes stop_codon:yes gene_type:complete
MTNELLPTTVVGSYVQPEWLVDRNNLKGRLPPRIRAHEIWRVDPEFLESAQNDATLLAIHDMERAGIDIVTDGEVRRESYSNRVATALGGVDTKNPGTAIDRTGHPNPVPRISGPIRRKRPIEVDDVKFLRAATDRKVKITLPGPFTMTQQAQNDFYDSDEAAAMDYAAAVNEEIHALFTAGADVVQLDEPYMQARPDIAKQYAIKAINRALEGVEGETAVHICFGYAHVVHERPEGYSFLQELEECSADQISIETAQSNLDLKILNELPSKKIILGVLDLSTEEIETPDTIADRIRRAFNYVSADRIIVAPDCGMKYMRRDVAFGKLKAMCDGATIVRREL